MCPRDYKNIPRERIFWRPYIDQGLCNGCGECYKVCPNNVFELSVRVSENRKAEVIRPEECIVFCEKCKEACPEDAIEFPDRESTEELVKLLLKQFDNPKQ